MLVIANGSSLLDVPISFLRKYPTIGMNHIAWYKPILEGFLPTYWVALDKVPLENLPYLSGVTKFIPQYFEEDLGETEEVVYFKFVERVAGMPYSHEKFVDYGTTTLAAVHLAWYMGAPNILLVGFNCTRAKNPTRKPAIEGINGAPHFYDPHQEELFHPVWDKQAKAMRIYCENNGSRLINLSNPTQCTTLPEEDWRDWA
jgi:hypothetical protein